MGPQLEELAVAVGARPVELLGALLAAGLRALAVGVWAVHVGRRRLDPSRHRRVVLAGVLVSAFAATVVFAGLAWGVVEGRALVAADGALARALHAASAPAMTWALRVFTRLGDTPALTVATIAVGVGLLRARRRLLAAGFVGAMIGTSLLSSGLKRAFARPRPAFDAPLDVAAGWSFPSGHAMGAIVATGMLSYVALTAWGGRRRLYVVLTVATLWTVAMGYSRLYLGVHYLSDVLGGFAAGLAWLGCCCALLEVLRPR